MRKTSITETFHIAEVLHCEAKEKLLGLVDFLIKDIYTVADTIIWAVKKEIRGATRKVISMVCNCSVERYKLEIQLCSKATHCYITCLK